MTTCCLMNVDSGDDTRAGKPVLEPSLVEYRKPYRNIEHSLQIHWLSTTSIQPQYFINTHLNNSLNLPSRSLSPSNKLVIITITWLTPKPLSLSRIMLQITWKLSRMRTEQVENNEHLYKTSVVSSSFSDKRTRAVAMLFVLFSLTLLCLQAASK